MKEDKKYYNSLSHAKDKVSASNEFDEKLYENNIKDNLSEMIVNELIIYLNRLK